MAWKSSQPRRRAALKSDRLSFRTTVRVGSPNACGSGLAAFSKDWVAMATPPSLVVARAECGKPGSTNLPDGTCCDRCSKYSAIEIHPSSRLGELCVCKGRMVCCVASPLAPPVFATAHINPLTPAQTGTKFKVPRLDEVSGRNVHPLSLDVATV